MLETYVSTDIEADGPIPGPGSMLSLASAAFGPGKALLSTFSANLETLPGAAPDPRTMAWWAENPAAWAACRTNPQPPDQAMRSYASWLEGLPGRPVFVGYPAAFDFLWVYWYLVRFTGSSPFTHSALDIKSYAMAMLRHAYCESNKRNMPARWFDPHPHTHVALDDAIEQGTLFCNMLEENTRPRTANDLAHRTRAALLEAALRAHEDAGIRGVCAEGRWEAAVDALRSLDLERPGERED